jgi:chromosome segregation ATPase
MTFGYQQGGSSISHKQALGFDAGASERLRMEAALKERQRIEKERAKTQLADLTRKFEHNKTEISHKEVDARRLMAEATHAMHDLEGSDRELKTLEDREHSLRVKAVEIGVQIQNDLKEEVFKKKDTELVSKNLEHIERQITQLQTQANEYKKQLADIALIIQKATLEIKKLEAEANKHQLDADHAKSERLYKIKDLDNKKREVQALEQRRMTQLSEVQRLKTENARIEIEIKRLEPKTH